MSLLFMGILAYLGIKILSGFFTTNSRTEVKGKPENKPIDLSKEDIEDVDFEETKDK